MKTHHLKCWPDYYTAVADGTKTFECCKNDRDYKVGDVLVIAEYNPGQMPQEGAYTGNVSVRLVTFILSQFEGVTEGFIIMGMVPCPAEVLNMTTQEVAHD